METTTTTADVLSDIFFPITKSVIESSEGNPNKLKTGAAVLGDIALNATGGVAIKGIRAVARLYKAKKAANAAKAAKIEFVPTKAANTGKPSLVMKTAQNFKDLASLAGDYPLGLASKVAVQSIYNEEQAKDENEDMDQFIEKDPYFYKFIEENPDISSEEEFEALYKARKKK